MSAALTDPVLSLLIRNTRNCYTARFDFDRLPITVGRHIDNRLRLDDPGVSRFHAVLEWHGGRLLLTDLGSVNGTFFQGFVLPPREPRELVGERFAFAVGPFHIAGRRELPLVVSAESDAPTANLSVLELGLLLRDEDDATLIRKLG